MAYKPYIKNSNGTLTDLPLQAEVAVKVGTSTVGSTTKPVYIKNGVPTQCSKDIATEVTNLQNQINDLQTQINNMLNGTTTFTLLKAKTVDLVD